MDSNVQLPCPAWKYSTHQGEPFTYYIVSVDIQYFSCEMIEKQEKDWVKCQGMDYGFQ